MMTTCCDQNAPADGCRQGRDCPARAQPTDTVPLGGGNVYFPDAQDRLTLHRAAPALHGAEPLGWVGTLMLFFSLVTVAGTAWLLILAGAYLWDSFGGLVWNLMSRLS